MGQITLPPSIHPEQKTLDSKLGGSKDLGILKIGDKGYAMYAFAQTGEVTEAAFTFLQDAANQLQNYTPSPHTFIYLSVETAILQQEMQSFLEELSMMHPLDGAPLTERLPATPQGTRTTTQNPSAKPLQKHPTQHSADTHARHAAPKVYSSIFSLAQQTASTNRQRGEPSRPTHPSQPRESKHPSLTEPSGGRVEFQAPQAKEKFPEREGQGKQQQGQQQPDDEQKNKKHSSFFFKKKKEEKISKLSSVERSTIHTPHEQPVASIENIYIRFMALMARILGQAELEAHQLYIRIKERTDNIDILTLLLSKVNSEKGAIDWSNNEEIKHLVDRSRALGVDIPADKYTWTEEEKKLLKENIQMRKDSMEKLTQLERTDMQRYLQEASQCHQARSNILKLLKEVMDTIIANMRP